MPSICRSAAGARSRRTSRRATRSIAENEELKREQLERRVPTAAPGRAGGGERAPARAARSTARVGDRVLIAEILAVDLDPYRQRFDLNRGIVDGAYVGQALIDAQGVVGQIMRSGRHVRSDADHRPRSRGAGERQPQRRAHHRRGHRRQRPPAPAVPDRTTPTSKVGDLLVSSGLGGVFPAGYPVGRVTEVRGDPGEPFAEVIAEPAAALDRDREVLLVWNAADEAPPNGRAARPPSLRAPERDVTDGTSDGGARMQLVRAGAEPRTRRSALRASCPCRDAVAPLRPTGWPSCCCTGRLRRRGASAC